MECIGSQKLQVKYLFRSLAFRFVGMTSGICGIIGATLYLLSQYFASKRHSELTQSNTPISLVTHMDLFTLFTLGLILIQVGFGLAKS